MREIKNTLMGLIPLILMLTMGEALAQARICDADGDTDIDDLDIDKIVEARGSSAGPNDPKDADRDGEINVLDVRQCLLKCSLPGCEINNQPTAVACCARTITRGETVRLDGTKSKDKDGHTLSYEWTLSTRPPGSTATLSDRTDPRPTFTTDDVKRIYEATLIVRDIADGVVISTSSPDTERFDPVNTRPTARVKINELDVDRLDVDIGDRVTLDGSGSTDDDKDSLTFRWSLTVPNGSVARLSDPAAVETTFLVDQPGLYEATLIVNDGFEDSEEAASVTIVGSGPRVNIPPTADAGENRKVALGSTVTLDGTASSDRDTDDILTYRWSLTPPPGSQAALSDNTSPTPSFVVDVPGDYTAQLIVNDGEKDSDPATVIISTENLPPVADAGEARPVQVGKTVLLDGSGSSDPDGDTLSYEWSFSTIPQGSSATLANATTETPEFVADRAGIYVAQLKVSDEEFSSMATVTITAASSSLEVENRASTDEVPEPGGQVTYLIWATNSSMAGNVIIDEFENLELGGDISGFCDPRLPLPATLGAGESLECEIVDFPVRGDPGDVFVNTAIARGFDEADNPVSDSEAVAVSIVNVQPRVAVTKTANPNTVLEGGNVTFTVEVRNESAASDPVTLESLIDDIHGDVTTPTQQQSNCALPQTIQPNDSYTCSFTVAVSGNPGPETDTVEARGTDDDGDAFRESASATVTIIDNPVPKITVTKTANPTSMPEPGGNVTFTVTVRNDSAPSDPVTLTSLIDDVYGDLQNKGCNVSQTPPIKAGDTFSCSFTERVSGNPGTKTDTVTASGTDDENNPVSGSASATVTITPAQPQVAVTKTANLNSVPEGGCGNVGSSTPAPGCPVTFDVQVTNNSGPSDPITLASLVDDIYGDLSNQGCAIPQTIQPSNSYTCSFTARINRNVGTETNSVEARGTDDDGAQFSASASAAVQVVPVDPVITVTKTATPGSVPESSCAITGTPPNILCQVAFQVTVTNGSGSFDPVTLTSLVDSIYGDLNGLGNCVMPQTIAPNQRYTCSFANVVTGIAGQSVTNTVTTSGTDDEGSAAAGSDSATVTIEDALPTIEVSLTGFCRGSSGSTFMLSVTNDSEINDPVTLTSLVSNGSGDLNGNGTCVVPQTIQPGSTYSCTYRDFISCNSLPNETVTASGIDDENNPVSDSASAVSLPTIP